FILELRSPLGGGLRSENLRPAVWCYRILVCTARCTPFMWPLRGATKERERVATVHEIAMPGLRAGAPYAVCCIALARILERTSYPAWSPSRARLSDLPRTASTSKIPGEVVRPVSAARSGCATAPSLTPSVSAKVRTAASVAAALQGS